MPAAKNLIDIALQHKNIELVTDCWSSIGDGWIPIFKKAVQKLNNLAAEKEKLIQIHQVKEKFGGLRIYIEAPEDTYDQAYKIISEAEAEADTTCENCGNPGKKTNSCWTKTLCKDCEKMLK